LFNKSKDGFEIDDSNPDEKNILERFSTVIEKYGFDDRPITFGLLPSPDLGYFDLADIYWRASLCLYLSGGVGCFQGSGIGFTEPWLFTVRHSIELRIKGFVLYTAWLENLNKDTGKSGVVSHINDLRKRFPKEQHGLVDIYNCYCVKINCIVGSWSTEITEEIPDRSKLLLNSKQKDVLKELNELDTKSFTFRYPTLKKGAVDVIQKADWKHDALKLYQNTGLPKESGYFFDHIKAVNSLHELNTSLVNISNYLNAIWDYIAEMQSLMGDLISGI